MEITREELEDKLRNTLMADFMDTLNDADLDQEEKHANVVLARKKISADAVAISDLVFRAYGS